MDVKDIKKQKEMLGDYIAKQIKTKQRIGLGTGTTAEEAIKAIGKRIKEEKLVVYAVPTSSQTKVLAVKNGIKLITFEDFNGKLDMAIDGADEFDSNLNLIKGAGGALTMEKIVDSYAKECVILADETKMVEKIGTKAVPIEIIPFSRKIVEDGLKKIGATAIELRKSRENMPLVTDNGNLILDVKFSKIEEALEKEINAIPGVVENGLFFNIAHRAIYFKNGKIEILNRFNGK